MTSFASVSGNTKVHQTHEDQVRRVQVEDRKASNLKESEDKTSQDKTSQDKAIQESHDRDRGQKVDITAWQLSNLNDILFIVF